MQPALTFLRPMQGATGSFAQRQLHRDGRKHEHGEGPPRGSVALRQRGPRSSVPLQLHPGLLDVWRGPTEWMRLHDIRLLRIAGRGRRNVEKGRTLYLQNLFSWGFIHDDVRVVVSRLAIKNLYFLRLHASNGEFW